MPRQHVAPMPSPNFCVEHQSNFDPSLGSCPKCKQQKVARWPTLDALIDSAAVESTAPRILTGIATIDTLIARRGLPLGRGVTTMWGPPGAGKTSLAAQWAKRWAETGTAVGIFAADEGPSGWIIRIAQQYGCDRQALEKGDADAWRSAKEFVARLPITMVDPDEVENACVEDLADTLPADRASVLIVDLVQTCRTGSVTEVMTATDRVEHVMADLKKLGKRAGLLVLALSEVSRGAYRSRKPGDRVDPLAAGKGSGSIESRSSCVLDLSSVENGNGAIDVLSPKTRFGRRGTKLRLAFDPERCVYTEIERPADADAKKRDAPLDAVKAKVRETLAKRHNLKSANEVFAVVGGSRPAVLLAVREMREGEPKEIVLVEGCLRLASVGAEFLAVPAGNVRNIGA